MAAAKVATTLLIWTVFFSALVLGGCGVKAQEGVHVVEETRSDGNGNELEQLKLKIHRLEVDLEESDKLSSSKDETIEKLKKVVQEKSDSISQLQSEVVSIQKKGTSDAEERVDKAYAQAAEIQNEVDRIKKELETESKEKDSLKTKANEAEKKIHELNLKLKNFQKAADEQQAKILKLERALQVAEEEMVKAKLEASSRTNELLEVHSAWLPPWFVEHTFHFQTFIATEWNKHGKPTMDVLTQKTLESKDQFKKWASPHIEIIKTTWVPAIQEQWIIIVKYLEPHVKLVSTKIAETYETSKTAVKPHLIKVQESADPYYQEFKKFSKPYVEQVATVARPHVEKARVALRPYTKNALEVYGKFLESTTVYHHQVQATLKEKMENHVLLKQFVTQELVWFLASALLALQVVTLFRIFSDMCCKHSDSEESDQPHCRKDPKRQTHNIKWRRPPDGTFKLNFDGSRNPDEIAEELDQPHCKKDSERQTHNIKWRRPSDGTFKLNFDGFRNSDEIVEESDQPHCRKDPERQTHNIKWRRSPDGTFKLNFDGSRNPDETAAFSFVIRDHNATVISMKGGICGQNSVVRAEALALRKGIEEAKNLRINRLQIKGDNLCVINALNGKWECPRKIEIIIMYSKMLLREFQHTTCQHILREINRVVDRISKLGHVHPAVNL